MLFPVFRAIHELRSSGINNDDFYDRLSRRYSTIIIGVSLLIATTTQFVGSPIHCFTQIVDHQHKIAYINWVCWISSLYYLPFDKPLPNRNQSTPERITYYPWIPFILFIMLILFYVPGLIWRMINKTAAIDTKVIISLLENMDKLNNENRKNELKSLVEHIDAALVYHHQQQHSGLIYTKSKYLSILSNDMLGYCSGNYLTVGYVFVKILYSINPIAQLFLLNLCMDNKFYLYGFDIMQAWFYGQDNDAVKRFPRITICQFFLRALGDNIQKYNVECALPNNLYNEKIFLVIWFWLCFISIFSVLGLIKWFYYFTFTSRRIFIHHYLEAYQFDYCSKPILNLDNELLRIFINRYCQQDGILLLRIVDENLDKVLTGELICAMWNHWRLQRQIHIQTAAQRIHNYCIKSCNNLRNTQSCIMPSDAPISIIYSNYIPAAPSLNANQHLDFKTELV